MDKVILMGLVCLVKGKKLAKTPSWYLNDYLIDYFYSVLNIAYHCGSDVDRFENGLVIAG